MNTPLSLRLNSCSSCQVLGTHIRTIYLEIVTLVSINTKSIIHVLNQKEAGYYNSHTMLTQRDSSALSPTLILYFYYAFFTICFFTGAKKTNFPRISNRWEYYTINRTAGSDKRLEARKDWTWNNQSGRSNGKGINVGHEHTYWWKIGKKKLQSDFQRHYDFVR